VILSWLLAGLVLAGTGLDVGEVAFDGNLALSPRDLATVVQTRPGTPYNAEVVAADEHRIERLYRESGYLQTTVNHRRALLGEHERLRITFIVSEGEPTIVTTSSVDGNSSLSERAVERELGVLRGKPLVLGDVGSVMRELRALYVSGAHPYATVTYDVAIDSTSRTASLVFHVEEGSRPVVSSLDVEGCSDVSPVVVLREVLIRPGDRYDGAKLRLSRYRLHELGLFRSVVFTLPGMEAARESLSMVVRVEEASTRWVEVATGYGSPDRLRVALGAGHDNLGSMARSMALRGQASYGWKLDRFVGRLEGALRDPWLMGLPLAGGIEGFVEERRELDSHFRKLGGALRLGKRWTERTETSAIYRYERRRTISLAQDASEELKEEAERQVTNSILASQRFDLRDSPVEPSFGGILTVTAREAGGVLGGDNHFRMATAEVAWFHPLFRRWIGGGRARLGAARPFGSSAAVPFDDRFRAGGAHTVRGYPEEGLGPLDTSGEPLGGEQIGLLSAEVRFPILGKFWGGLFADGGQVWATAWEASLRDLQWGAGAGVRYLTFLGPLRLDWAVPLPKGRRQIYVAFGHAF
jgi:outer membrane protein assembly complex protein YaeT